MALRLLVQRRYIEVEIIIFFQFGLEYRYLRTRTREKNQGQKLVVFLFSLTSRYIKLIRYYIKSVEVNKRNRLFLLEKILILGE
jgi:hypothetical protein